MNPDSMLSNDATAGQVKMSDNSDRNFHDIVEGLPQTVYEIDLDGRIVYANQRGLEITGRSAAEIAAGLNAIELFAHEAEEIPHESLWLIIRLINRSKEKILPKSFKFANWNRVPIPQRKC